MPNVDRLFLHCDSLNSTFTLAQEGKEWRRSFESFEDAYENAELRATDVTPLVLYDEQGKVILELTLAPLSTELANHIRLLPVKTVLPT